MSRSSSSTNVMPEKPAPPPKISEVPDPTGRFGEFGGAFVPDNLVPALQLFADTYLRAMRDDRFWDELRDVSKSLTGRPTPLLFARRLTNAALRRANSGDVGKIWLKREDLCHTGSSAINNVLGQAMLAREMGKKRVIAETATGQHGVAAATAAARLGLDCQVYMGSDDVRRRTSALARMKILGAKVVEVDSGCKTVREAISAAINEWSATTDSTHYIPGGATGPHPFPTIVRDFQAILGTETKAQSLRLLTKLPDAIVAAVGGPFESGVSAGLFFPFVDDDKVQLVGVEAGGRGNAPGEHAAPLSLGKPGTFQGSDAYVLQDETGQTQATHSVAAGLDYAGAGPEHSYWKHKKRVRYTTITDAQAIEAFTLCCTSEGIVPSLESAHAIAEALDVAAKMKGDQNVVVCVSGRGEKDVDEVARLNG